MAFFYIMLENYSLKRILFFMNGILFYEFAMFTMKNKIWPFISLNRFPKFVIALLIHFATKDVKSALKLLVSREYDFHMNEIVTTVCKVMKNQENLFCHYVGSLLERVNGYNCTHPH